MDRSVDDGTAASKAVRWGWTTETCAPREGSIHSKCISARGWIHRAQEASRELVRVLWGLYILIVGWSCILCSDTFLPSTRGKLRCSEQAYRGWCYANE